MTKIIPKDKHDLNVCNELNNASDTEVIESLSELLEWTKDINWEVTQCILDRIAKLDIDTLAELITNILDSDDSLWKYTILTVLLPNVDCLIINKISKSLKRISEKPTEDEIDEEIDMIASNLLPKK